MTRIREFLFAAVAAFVLSFTGAARAIPEYDGCEGPPELCEEVMNLREEVAKLEEIDKAKSEETHQKIEEAKSDEKKDAEGKAARSIVIAAIIAVVLRQILQSLKGWKGFFTTDKAKGWVRVITIVIGLAAFVAANIGMGIPWWQAAILAGGGPGAMAVDGIIKMIPVLLGKKKYEDAAPASDGDPSVKDPSDGPPGPGSGPQA